MGSTGVEKLPEDFGMLSGLTHLYLHECSNLHTLPESSGT